ncbi:glycoside hydrolase family 3 C-terminal domain-containing protein [Mumia sp. zg.B17]|uniref:beta-xylosidase/alpha-l-arabinosidase n=1 Tax=Mumia sp. zg.B17 TaxID=2855446 RepID=UPI001C6E8B4B|nr:glycoside hydrolase family 3 N-terminal domain-containing protein [Mumia sp. zg.B17]MBW9206825.1 glycoside hydrolase family 3 C-terminal domain-containing protein [Mumia sp. zg.B17]
MNLWNDPAASVDERADALLAAMSLDEKVGQLASFWPQPAASSQVAGDVAPMESAMSDGLSWDESIRHGLGHLTRNFGTEPVSVDDGVKRLRDYQRQVVDQSRFGIPAIAHEECLTGFTTYGATVYPAAIAWGATFDPDLVEEMAAAIGSDMKAVGVDQGLSPVLDVVRDYRWGRVEETLGEDPYVVGTLGAAYVRGLEGAGIVATLKHFAGYSASKAARNHAPVSIGPRELEDMILPPFEMAIREGGARSVMNSYSDVDGLPALASNRLLTHVLRDRWGFRGTVVADYFAVAFLETTHRVAAGPRAAGILALEAGLDVELPSTTGYADLASAVADGVLDEAYVDRAARRVLRQKIELGMLDPAYDPTSVGESTDLDSPRNRDVSRRLAEQSIVLLSNDGVLPLQVPSRIALVGPCADDPNTFMGCYSFPNHVLSRYGGDDLGVDVPTLLDALRGEVEAEVVHHLGVPVTEADRGGLDAAVGAAAESDVAVVVVGDLAGLFGLGTSGEGCDAVDLRLPGIQEELVERVVATGTPTVLVVVSGRPYALGAFADRCAAIVQAFMLGEEGGAALAGVLTGRLNPEGKLPVGIPAHHGGQPGTYLGPPLAWYSEGISNLDPRPLFPFGHGIGYTSFELTDLHISEESVATDGMVEVAATVTNVGDRAGAEVVQLYLGDPLAQVTRPLKQLVGYAKVRLDAGCSATVTFDVHMDRTSFTGRDLERVVEPGRIDVTVGTSSEDRRLTGRFEITGETRVVDEGRVLTTPVRIDG